MEERRKASRGRTYLSGQIEFDNRRCAADCLVRNLSLAGAKIVFSALAPIPNEFDFTIQPSGDSRRARIAWRKDLEAGVAFLSAATHSSLSIETARQIRSLEAQRQAPLGGLAAFSRPPRS